jgi:hypothetical protein
MDIRLKIHLGGAYDFATKKDLNPKIWLDGAIRSSIRQRLLMIANNFIEYLDIVNPESVVDIQFTGSLANYNYTKYSDIDLHVIIDLDKIGENENLINAILRGKRITWNNNHNIKIKGYEVEGYPQDSKEEHASTGVYSILHNKWLIRPERIVVALDKKQIMKKVISFQERFYEMLKERPAKRIDLLKGLKQKILEMRKAGLSSKGEYSNENLTFKVLRRLGFLGSLNKEINKAIDEELSLNGL